MRTITLTPARTLLSLTRWVGRSFMPRPIILMYHRVAELPADPQLLAVRPARFAEQLEVLRADFRPRSLSDLLSGLHDGRFGRRTVVITMDDGYADNLVAAKPLLERFAIPATVFVATDYIGRVREFWWDELERLLLQPGHLPQVVRLRLDGRSPTWEMGEAAEYSPDDYERDRWWHVDQDYDPGPRQRVYRALYQLLHQLPDADKWALLDELRLLVGAEPGGRATHRTLTPDELVRLADGGLIEIGAHTATHPALAGIPLAKQRQEIEGSKAMLEATLNRPISSFAYPHGSYGEDTVCAVADAGFNCACTSDPQRVARSSNPFRLPRVVPRDWDGDTFARWLTEWVG